MPYPRRKTEDYARIDGLDRRSSFFVGEVPRALELRNLTYQRPGSFTPRPGSEIDPYSGYSTGITAAMSEVFFVKAAKYGLSASLSNRTYLFASEQRLMMQAFAGTQVILETPPTNNQGTPAPWTSADFIRTFAANGTHFIAINVEDDNNGKPRYLDAITGNWSGVLGAPLYVTYSDSPLAWQGSTGFVRYCVASAFFSTADNIRALAMVWSNTGITATTGAIHIHANVGGTGLPPYGYSGPPAAFLCRQQGSDPNYYLLGPMTISIGSSYVSFFDRGSRTDTIAGVSTAFGAWPPFSFKPKLLAEFNNALFAGNLTVQPTIPLPGESPAPPLATAPESTVAYSALGQPAIFGATQTFQVGADVSEPLTGMRSWQTQLIIGKRRSLYVLTGSDSRTYSLRQISKTVGVVGPNAFAEYDGGRRLAIIGDSGIWSWDGSSLDDKFSEKIYDTFAPSPGIYSSGDAWTERKEAWFWLSPATLGTNADAPPRARVAVFDFLVNEWWEDPNHRGNCGAYVEDVTAGGPVPPAMYFGGSSNMVFRHRESRRNDLMGLVSLNAGSGLGFTCIFASAFRDEEGKSTEKIYRRLRTDMSINQGASASPSTYGGLTLLVTAQIRVNGLTATVVERTFNAGVTGAGSFWLNFGVNAKQAAARWIFGLPQPGTTMTLFFNGYALESRYLRSS